MKIKFLILSFGLMATSLSGWGMENKPLKTSLKDFFLNLKEKEIDDALKLLNGGVAQSILEGVNGNSLLLEKTEVLKKIIEKLESKNALTVLIYNSDNSPLLAEAHWDILSQIIKRLGAKDALDFYLEYSTYKIGTIANNRFSQEILERINSQTLTSYLQHFVNLTIEGVRKEILSSKSEAISKMLAEIVVAKMAPEHAEKFLSSVFLTGDNIFLTDEFFDSVFIAAVNKLTSEDARRTFLGGQHPDRGYEVAGVLNFRDEHPIWKKDKVLEAIISKLDEMGAQEVFSKIKKIKEQRADYPLKPELLKKIEEKAESGKNKEGEIEDLFRELSFDSLDSETWKSQENLKKLLNQFKSQKIPMKCLVSGSKGFKIAPLTALVPMKELLPFLSKPW